MARYIDADALIERLEKLENKCRYNFFREREKNGRTFASEYADGKRFGITEIIKVVKKLAEEHNNGWISCEKELPPQPEANPIFEGKPLELYMVSEKGVQYPCRAFWNGKCFTDGFGRLDVEAWQPLPQKYKKEGAE